MAGLPWLKVAVDFADHPKAFALASRLSDPCAPLHLPVAWGHFARHYADGSMPDTSTGRSQETDMVEEVGAVADRESRDTVSAKVRAAEERREQCDAEMAKLEGQIAAVQETLRAIEDAPEVTQSDLLDRENARRKLRTLKASVASVRAAAQKAEADLAESQLAADRLELQDLREEVRKDVIALGEYFLGLEQEALERLTAHRKLVADRRALEDAVRVASGGVPGTHTGGTVFSSIPEAEGELWDGIARALLVVREMGVKRQRVPPRRSVRGGRKVRPGRTRRWTPSSRTSGATQRGGRRRIASRRRTRSAAPTRAVPPRTGSSESWSSWGSRERRLGP